MANSRQKPQKAVKRKRDAGPTLTMRCEWPDCGLTSTDTEHFSTHVETHAAAAAKGEDGQDKNCLWHLCGFNSVSAGTMRFHVNYHSYHTMLKAIGTGLLSRNAELHHCHHDTAQRNMVGLLSDEKGCEWEGCDFETSNYGTLVQHSRTHVTGQPRRTKHQIVYCLWEGCGKSQKDMTKLKSHLRSHTQEKAVACPTCGSQFASKTKFVDHCARQAPLSYRLSKCSYCKKSFPSERILQDHYRVHTHMHKCPMCDMTCPYMNTLALHMRYRHLKERPFVCNFCQHGCKTERDLKTHYQSHSGEDMWACDEFGCDFRARSANGLAAHKSQMHGKPSPRYGCHICDAIYRRGAKLTQHLKREHAYRWASGMSRFRYIKDESGVYRLQTVRHESLEVVEQIVANATIRRRRLRQRKRFAIVQQSPTSIVISQQATSSRDESDVDDPDEMEDEDEEEEEEKEVHSESDVSVLEHSDMPDLSMDEKEENEEEFGERLKQHLGLVKGFIQLVE